MDNQFSDNVVKNAFELWITPEVTKRQEAGSIEKPYALTAAQVMFPPEGGYYVRLNSEIRGVAYTRAARDVKQGEPVIAADWEGLETFDVCEEDLDNGHFTLLRVGDRWAAIFNFLRRRSYCASLLEKARQFLQTAESAQYAGHNAPAVDNLFSAAELVSKAHLLLHSMIDIDNKTHGPIASAINREKKMDNVNGAFVSLFNLLSQSRQPVRYNAGPDEGMYLSADDFELVGAFIDRCVRLCEISKPDAVPQVEQAIRKNGSLDEMSLNEKIISYTSNVD